MLSSPFKSHAMNSLEKFFPSIPSTLTHMPYWTMEKVDESVKNFGYYTHNNPGAEKNIPEFDRKFSGWIAMSNEGREELRRFGARKPIHVAYPPTAFNYQPIKVMVVGAEQPNGRKDTGILLDLLWKNPHLIKALSFLIIGTGWKDEVQKLANLGAFVAYIEKVDVVPYGECDVLLSTGFVEGGPLPVLEALAAGKRVLTPKYGVGSDILEGEFLYDSVQELAERLTELVLVRKKRCALVESFTPHNYQRGITNFIEMVCNLPASTRYGTLVREVRESKAKRILEIGVYQGTTAQDIIEASQESMGEVYYTGVDLFELTSEEKEKEFSKFPSPIEAVLKRLRSTGASIQLLKGNSYEKVRKLEGPFDLIFVDGGHSWETIEKDWKGIQHLISDKTVVIFDDYYPYYEDDLYGIGCQKLLRGLDSNTWNVEVLEPGETWPQSFGDLTIHMAKVTKRG